MEIYDKRDKGFIEVWLTNAEQEICDRKELTELLLSSAKGKKCRVVYYLSGNEELFSNTEKLLLANSGCI